MSLGRNFADNPRDPTSSLAHDKAHPRIKYVCLYPASLCNSITHQSTHVLCQLTTSTPFKLNSKRPLLKGYEKSKILFHEKFG